MKTVYLDNNATTAVAPEVYEAAAPFLTSVYFNPSSMYGQARDAAAALERARGSVCSLLGGALPSEILFTSCATESNNWAIFGTVHARPERRHIITTAVEHPSVIEVCREAKRRGWELSILPVDSDGRLDSRNLIEALRPDTLIVSIMHANNETGAVFPIAELSRIVKETDPAIVFHTDATQSAGKLDLDTRQALSNVDLLSFSGHKLHAPKGVGVLYIRQGTPCRPFMFGGHQEKGRRAGTENVAFIAAIGRACELAGLNREAEAEKMRKLRDRLERELVRRIPYAQVNAQRSERLPNTLNLSCHYIEGEGILYQLNELGICASSGSACTSGSLDPSHVLKAMNVPFTAIHGSVRFSLSRYTTEAEIDEVIRVFPQIVENLRRLSPYWDPERNAPRLDAPGLAEVNLGIQ